MKTVENSGAMRAGVSPSRAWLRALELTSPIPRNPDRILPVVIAEMAALRGDAPAMISSQETLTYEALIRRANQYARWALDQGLAKGDVVCLLMANRPEYFAAWLGITSAGVVVSLLNTHLVSSSLAHCIRIVSPRHIIASSELASTLRDVLPHLDQPTTTWAHGMETDGFARIDAALARYSADPLETGQRRSTTIDDLAL